MGFNSVFKGLNFEVVDITLPQTPGISFSIGTKSCRCKNGTVNSTAVRASRQSLFISFLPFSDRCTVHTADLLPSAEYLCNTSRIA